MGGLRSATIADSTTIAVNRVILMLQDEGEIGSSGSSVRSGGFWKAQTEPYLFSSGFNIGARLHDFHTIVFANGGPFSEFHPGSERFPELGEYWDSSDPRDRIEYPAACSVDTARISRFPALTAYAGEPFPGFADRTLCIAVNDYTGPTCGECGGMRVGVTIVETIFGFTVPTVQDFVFVALRVYNDSRFINESNAPIQQPGPYPLLGVHVGIAADPDVGDAGDDQIAFLPEIQTMAYWDHDFRESGFRAPPGIGGIALVVPPVDPSTGREAPLDAFTLFTGGAPRPDPSSKEVWYAIMEGDPSQVIYVVDPRDVRAMVSTSAFTLQPDQFVEMIVAYFFAEVSGPPPADLRGEAHEDLFTGQPIPDANDDPAFDLFRQQARVAISIATAGFLDLRVLPSPEFAQIPSDRQITVVWDDGPVATPNPLAIVVRAPFDPENPQPTGYLLQPGDIVFFGGRFQTVAEAGLAGAEVTNPAFNPDFVVFDLEGFRIYRSWNFQGNDAELIAQFDRANDIAGGEFCIAAEPVFDAMGNFIKNVCTSTALQASRGGTGIGDLARFGSNTGLAFSVVDRGGPFPDPSSGSGLVNGIPIAHAVTTFTVQCGILRPVIMPGTETVPPAACLSLESSKIFKLSTSESISSSFVPAEVAFDALKADGTVCDTSEPAYTVDATTGDFVDILDCSDAIEATVSVNRGENLPTGDFFFVVDRLTHPCQVASPDCYTLAAGGNTAHWHWERADGSPATEIVPQSGTVDQRFALWNGEASRMDFGLDANPMDVGNDLDLSFVIHTDFSAIDDLEINGQSLALLELGGQKVNFSNLPTPTQATRPHRVANSSLATIVNIGMMRSGTNSREYAHPGAYATGAASFELTWTVEGGAFRGTLRRLPGGQEVPHGGRPMDPVNNSTAGDFTAGYNWGFCAPATTDAVRACVSPGTAGPLVDQVQLAVGSNFAIYVPGNSVYLEGLKVLPQNGERWVFRITGCRPEPNCFAGMGRRPGIPPGPFNFGDDSRSSRGDQVVNLFPGARWRLSIGGGTNELADADLDAIQVVPNPFMVWNEAMRGPGLQRILFTNLPPVATIRIYTISGNLVRILEHTDGSGTEPFDVRTRWDLLLASGNYYYHVTTPDGRTHLARFAVIN